jgi:hypothetical protein
MREGLTIAAAGRDVVTMQRALRPGDSAPLPEES